jgi:RNA 2',3'-cyclic 3'-phosphodiesterase
VLLSPEKEGAMFQIIIPDQSPDQRINLFFALLPEPNAATQAHRIALQHHSDRRMTGRVLRKDRLHVTLLSVGSFIGEVPKAFMDLALSIGDAVTLSSFEVAFDRALSFPCRTGNRPYVLLGGDCVSEIMPLHCGLVGAMFREGLDPPQMPAFNPHMTLAYDARHHMELPVEPVSWTAREFVLIESLVGRTIHIVRGRWPLRERVRDLGTRALPSPAVAPGSYA